jgi:hypothetical protein
MAIFFLFHSNYTFEAVKRTIKDGVVRIGNKEWIVDKIVPFRLKKILGDEPVYMLNWKSLVPMSPKDFNVIETDMTPEMFKRLVELKIFDFLLKRFKAETPIVQNVWMLIAVGAVVGALALYGLIMFKVLPANLLPV